MKAQTSSLPGNPLEVLTLEQLRRRTSKKWRTYPADVLPLWVAEMDVPVAPAVREAVTGALDLGDTGYPAGTALTEALARFASAGWGWDAIDPARTALVPDVMLGAAEAIRLVTDPGDAVVVSSPVYTPFYGFIAHAGRQVREAPLAADGRIDPATLEDAFREARHDGQDAAYLLCNPHNPTGAVHWPDELAQVAELARRHGVRVISDEIHAPLVLPGAEFTPYLTVPGAEDAFALMSASKGWNLAGLKAGLLIAGDEARADLDRLTHEAAHGASHLGAIAHTAAFTHGTEWLDRLLSGLDANRTLLASLLETHLPDARLLQPEGTYLAWIDCRPLELVTEDPARFFREEARVALNAGDAYGTGGEGHVRLNFATSAAVLTEAIERMGRAVQTRRG